MTERIKLDRDLFFRSVDWISVVPEGKINDKDVNLVGLGYELDKYDIEHTLKKNFDVFYYVIAKEDLYRFCKAFDSQKFHCRITRIDVRFDFEEKFSNVFNDHKKELSYSSFIANEDGCTNTVYFGSRESGLFARLYNKTLESHLDQDITRLEYEIKGSIALQFSVRWQEFGFQDAVDYLSKWFTEFNITTGLSSIIGLFDFNAVKPYDFFKESEIKYKMRRFIKQYRNSMLTYFDYCGGINNFHELLFDQDYLKLCEKV